jgi:hypothetical protein
MANFEATECANQDFNSIAINAMISVGVAINLGFVGALSPSLYAALIATGLCLAGWILVEHVPDWLMGLSTLARSNDFSISGPKTTSGEIAVAAGFVGAEAAFEVVPAVAAEELLNFDPLVESHQTWSPADILKITDPDEIFKFALDYNKQAPEVASRNLRFVVREWGAKPETKIIWMTAIKKIEFHNDGQAMANLFFGGELPTFNYSNAQGQPVSCWEDAVRLPSQMQAS